MNINYYIYTNIKIQVTSYERELIKCYRIWSYHLKHPVAANSLKFHVTYHFKSHMPDLQRILLTYEQNDGESFVLRFKILSSGIVLNLICSPDQDEPMNGACNQGVWNIREMKTTRPALPYEHTCFTDGVLHMKKSF